MEIKIENESVTIEKIEKVLDILVNGKKVTVVKWHFFEKGIMLDDGSTILSVEAYGELEDDEREALNDFIDNIKI